MSINLKKVPNTPGVYKFFKNHEIILLDLASRYLKRTILMHPFLFKDKEMTFPRQSGINWLKRFTNKLLILSKFEVKTKYEI